MMIPFQLDSIRGKNGIIEKLVIKNMDEEKKELKVDYFLPFFGLSTNLGPIKRLGTRVGKKYSEGQTGNLRNKLKWNICDW